MDTICSKFVQSKSRGDRTAITYARRGQWIEVSWEQYYENVEQIAAALHELGVRHGDRVAILSNTRVEWAYIDTAILCLGAITVPIYQSSTPDDVEFILNDSGAKLLICESSGLVKKFNDVIVGINAVKNVITIEKGRSVTDKTYELHDLEKFQKSGEKFLKTEKDFLASHADEVDITDIATVIYTSGTTGRPRGVVLTHAAILSEVADSFPLLGVTPKDRSLCFLPFAHILGRIEIWGHILIGYTMGYAENIDRIKDNLLVVKPTLLIAVPRIFEKIYNGILAQTEISSIKKKVFSWAIEIGKEISRHKIDKQPVPLDISIRYQLAKRLVFDKITSRLGGNLRFAVCGGAPLSRPLAEFFHAAGILILEGYGLSETTGAVAVNTPFDYRFGTVGKAIGDVKFKIAEDGEILVQSRKVMREYWNDPEATAQVLVDGWFHTGDMGELSAEGYLRITDRKKNLIKTAGGKYIAPQKIEGLLKVNPYISQVHIYGDRQKYVIALVTLNPESIKKFASENGVAAKDVVGVVQHPKVKDLVRKAIAEANSHLASFESVKNFAILPGEFTVESGELTPSLKIKRKVVEERHKDLIESLYN